MIRGWFVKLAIGAAIFGVLAFELASPHLAGIQVDAAASKAAFESRLQFERSPDQGAARARANEEAAKAHAVVESYSVGPDAAVELVLYRRAKSLFADRWDRLNSYYDVRVSASSKRGPAG